MRAPILSIILILFLIPAFSGCDRIYGLIHKPGGEEQAILGQYVFNEYSAKVEEMQKILILLGYQIGRPDGKFGSSSRDAVAKFQTDEGLEITRFVDKATWGKMRAYVDSPLIKDLKIDGKGLQIALNKAGFLAGKPDGQIGPRTRQALKDFQSSQGLTPDGMIGSKTLRALFKFTTIAPTKTPSQK